MSGELRQRPVTRVSVCPRSREGAHTQTERAEKRGRAGAARFCPGRESACPCVPHADAWKRMYGDSGGEVGRPAPSAAEPSAPRTRVLHLSKQPPTEGTPRGARAGPDADLCGDSGEVGRAPSVRRTPVLRLSKPRPTEGAPGWQVRARC
jgi:hypothetical protein